MLQGIAKDTDNVALLSEQQHFDKIVQHDRMPGALDSGNVRNRGLQTKGAQHQICYDFLGRCGPSDAGNGKIAECVGNGMTDCGNAGADRSQLVMRKVG